MLQFVGSSFKFQRSVNATHTISLNLLGSPDRCARGSANRLKAVIARTIQLGSPRNPCFGQWAAGLLYTRLYYNDAIITDVSTCGRC